MKLRILPALALGLALPLAACQQQAPAERATSTAPAEAAAPAPAAAGAAPLYSTDITASIDRYEALARDIASRLGDAPDAVAVAADLEALMALSAEVTPAFIARHPGCKAYLEAALAVHRTWPELDAETIERDYHQDAALPAEGTPPVCYHMRDLIVHPATALVLLRQAEPDAAEAKHEIDEVIAHVAVVRAG